MSAEPAPAASKSVKKRQAIVDAAARALADHGYAEVKLSDIARDVGTHAGSLYYYFPSREDLVREVMLTSLERMQSQFADAVAAQGDEVSSLDRLTAFIRAILARRTSAKDDYLRAYMRNYNQVPEVMRKELSVKRHQVRNEVRRLVVEAQGSGQIPPEIDATLAALFIVGAANWVGVWYEASGPNPPDEITDTFIRLILHGLRGGEAG